MPDRKKPNWLLWTISVLILLPVLYVASFGPACWISSRTANASILVIYRPLIRLGTQTVYQPKWHRTPLQRFLKWYADLGADCFSNFSDDHINWMIFEGR